MASVNDLQCFFIFLICKFSINKSRFEHDGQSESLDDYDLKVIYTCCKTVNTPRSSIHSLKIRMTSHPCNKYEQKTLPYLLSVLEYNID